MKQVVIAVAAAVAFATAAGSVVRADKADTETFPVSFVITSASCAHLPAGTTISGSGTETSITVVNTNHDGTATFINSSHAVGTATDQDGNTYVFQYSNEFRVSNSAGDPGLFSGLMTDAFSLTGRGPAKLHNGFVADVVTDFDSLFAFDPRQSHGDPIDFVTGASHCDPL